jgi:hypothetical protein
VFVVTGHNPQMAEQQNNVIDAALQAGVKVSGASFRRSGGGDGPDSPTRRRPRPSCGRRTSCAAARLGWVILRPGLFMQNVLGQAAAIKSRQRRS